VTELGQIRFSPVSCSADEESHFELPPQISLGIGLLIMMGTSS
jgi:hypothetical protein